jgi:hypothetical protein
MPSTIEPLRDVTPGTAPTDPARRAVFFGGSFSSITVASSIPAVSLRDPVMGDSRFVFKPSAGTMHMVRS